VLRDEDWDRYFGRELGRPCFRLVSLERLDHQLEAYEDVPLWRYSNARVLGDPCGQFKHVMRHYRRYPRKVLVRKIKYRWLLAGYWEVECFPHHHARHEAQGDGFLAGASAIINSANELLRLCFLVEGQPFPYTERLLVHAWQTALGKEICPILEQSVALAVGAERRELPVWDRLDQAADMLMSSDTSEDCRRLEAACSEAMIAAGVDKGWVQADYSNIEELLLGQLGPLPG